MTVAPPKLQEETASITRENFPALPKKLTGHSPVERHAPSTFRSSGRHVACLQLVMVSTQPRIDRWLETIQTEYREMPGLHLTKPQARRMWNLDVLTCDAVLDLLEDQKFLRRTRNQAYVRASP